MGTEQQQEFKSVKSSTKPKRKVIPFYDHSMGGCVIPVATPLKRLSD